ncbi:LysR family transcriptional regulator [Clostridium sp. MCC353]|uniref:LysR family transcriptional regulator n=1 Tax=Clostridium sp. MCC353 TaxID=2592646 RepID=UPI001C017E74|nr:LysR family transcriptional regulator [Clostridium sp. MCC353]MBT9778460.1 LysR family transcriptional regulator [Clostridium sp. MCC353]
MDTRYLEYIAEIDKQRNITNAAKTLYVSQSSLSQYLSKLEKELGAPLFTRGQSELIPTPLGEMYISYAKKALELKKSAYKSIRQASQIQLITIGSSSAKTLQKLYSVLPEFRRHFPHTEVEILDSNLSNIEKSVMDGSFDLALVTTCAVRNFPGLSEALENEEVVFVLPSAHPCRGLYPPGEKLTASQAARILEKGDFILQKPGNCIRYLVDDFFKELPNIPSAGFSLNQADMIRSLISGGIGAAFLPIKHVIHRDLDYYSLSPQLYRMTALIRRKNLELTDAHVFLMDLIRKETNTE